MVEHRVCCAAAHPAGWDGNLYELSPHSGRDGDEECDRWALAEHRDCSSLHAAEEPATMWLRSTPDEPVALCVPCWTIHMEGRIIPLRMPPLP